MKDFRGNALQWENRFGGTALKLAGAFMPFITILDRPSALKIKIGFLTRDGGAQPDFNRNSEEDEIEFFERTVGLKIILRSALQIGNQFKSFRMNT